MGQVGGRWRSTPALGANGPRSVPMGSSPGRGYLALMPPTAGLWNRLGRPQTLARAHGGFNIVGGLWPLLGVRSFEAVFGPKEDRWLEYTVAGLLLVNGVEQVLSSRRGEVETARRLGIGTAATLAAIDAVYVPAGRIRWTYAIDAVLETGWIVLWIRRGRT
jgi:hypothetical protein